MYSPEYDHKSLNISMSDENYNLELKINYQKIFIFLMFFFFTDTAYRFFGNQTHTDYFKLLRKDGQSLLIGARNVIYNISLPYLTENLDQVSKNL